MGISIGEIEYFLMILVRISAFVYTAPFLSTRNVPFRVKTGLAVCLAIMVQAITPYEPLIYTGVIGYALMVMKEAVAGAAMGFFANIAQYILAFVGQRMDIDIGFSMVSGFNAVSQSEVTVTGSFYSYAVILMMMVTELHLVIVRAIIESFQLIPVGGAVIDVDIYKIMLVFITDYFILGFRIVLPVYAAVLLVDTILAILAKVAPQMNMFAVGIQIKIAVGIVMLYLMVRLIPYVSELIFEEMFQLLRDSVSFLGGG